MATRIVRPSSQILPTNPTLYAGIEIREYWRNPYTYPAVENPTITEEDEFGDKPQTNKTEGDLLLAEAEDTEGTKTEIF